MGIATHEELDVNVPLYLELFKTRDDCFAVQRDDGSYGPLNIEFEDRHVEEHITGKRTYGQYLVDPDGNTCVFAAIDNDIDDDSGAPLENALDAAVREKQRALNFGLRENQVWLEFSGRRGYHVWFFFDPPIKAALAKQFLERITGTHPNAGDDDYTVTIDGGHLEVFPKQAALAAGEYGNLIKTPFGFHQKTDQRMVFVDEAGDPFTDQNAILRAAIRNRIDPAVVGGILEEFGDDTEEIVERADERAANRGCDPAEVVDPTLGIRPCIEKALRREVSAPHDETGALRGDAGHQMRLAIAAELLNNGVSVDEAVEYFRVFPNFKESVTREKLEEIKRSGHKPWRCETLKSNCGAYVEDCPCPATTDIDPVTSMELNHERYSHMWNSNDE